MIYLLLALAALAVPIVLPVLSWVYAKRTRARLERLEQRVSDMAEALARLERVLERAPSGSPAAHAGRAPAFPSTAAATPPPPAGVNLPGRDGRVAERSAPERDEAVPVPAYREAAPASSPPRVPATTPPPVMAPPPPMRTPAPPAPEAAPAPAFDWESLVGVKLFSAIAGIALVFAAVFFLRYSIEHGWLQPPVQFAIGVLVALALLIVCEVKAARRYPATANAMDAAAVAILFATFFAAHALWHLIPAGASFGLLAMVTALAVALSIRRDSLFIAVLGLLGGFATPALLSSGENEPVPLFAYLMLLNVGVAWVAYRQRWPILTALSLVLTTVYQWGWVLQFLDASQVPLALGIFLVFPVIGIAALVAGDARATEAPLEQRFERTALVAAAMPLLFAVYLAAVPGYGERPWLLFGFLLLVDAGLLAVAIARRQELLHAAGAAVTLAVMATWLALSFVPGRGAVALAATAAFVLFFALARPLAARFGTAFTAAGLTAGFAAPLLLFAPMALARTEPAFARPTVLFAATLILVLLVAWRAIVEARGPLYFVAAFFAIGVQGTWSAVHFSSERLAGALAWYLLFALVALGVPMVARRAGAAFRPRQGSGLVVLASVFLLIVLATVPSDPQRLWALALILAAANGVLFIDGASAPLPGVSIAAGLTSALFLLFWWLHSAGAVAPPVALAAIVLLTTIVLAAHAWEQVSGGAEGRGVVAGTTLGTGLFPGLLGHLFLLAFVTQPKWSIPPWRWMVALAVVTTGASLVSLVTGAAGLHRAAAIAAALIVTVWAAVAAAPWMLTAILASLAVSAFALVWLRATRAWTAAARNVAATGAAGALFLGEATAVIGAGASVPAPFLAVLAAQVLNLSAILALAFMQRWPGVASLAVVPAAAALIVQTGGAGHLSVEWPKLFLLALAIYAVFVAYPALAVRTRRDVKDPYLAVVLASAVFFFAAKAALEAGGYRSIVGIVPLFEAAVLGVLLRQLVRVQPASERDTGRLALVAGAALAFVTVAIPVQLEHQWITVGWALEAAALAWLYGRLRHRGLVIASAALFAAVFARLALNPAVLYYHPRGSLRILNWYLYTYLLAAAAFLFGAWRFRLSGDGGRVVRLLARWLPAGAVVLLFLLLNIEIADFFATGPAVVFRFGVTVPQDLTYTIAWLVFGMVLLGTCIYLRSHAGRVAALALIAVTTFKCFLYDLGSLEGLYRVASFVGLATALALVSLALQKYVLARPEPR